jgi:hypothetical protein
LDGQQGPARAPNIRLVLLPPYPPEINPVERVCRYLKVPLAARVDQAQAICAGVAGSKLTPAGV